MSHRLLFLLVLLLVPLGAAHSAESPWFQTDGARMRLIMMASPTEPHIRAGLQFELEPGWKTYWRTPGNSGLPPQVVALGSTNVAKIKLRLPTPELFPEKKGATIGYTGNVVFPIEVVAEDGSKDIKLNLRGVVGICADVCIPVPFSFSASQKTGAATPFQIARLLNDAEANVPKPPHADHRVQAVRLVGDASKTVIIESVVPKSTTSATLLVEGPREWYLTHAQLRDLADGAARFSLQIPDARSVEDLADTEFTFTLIADGVGVEQRLAVQAPN